jgi:hypothetical protein
MSKANERLSTSVETAVGAAAVRVAKAETRMVKTFIFTDFVEVFERTTCERLIKGL